MYEILSAIKHPSKKTERPVIAKQEIKETLAKIETECRGNSKHVLMPVAGPPTVGGGDVTKVNVVFMDFS